MPKAKKTAKKATKKKTTKKTAATTAKKPKTTKKVAAKASKKPPKKVAKKTTKKAKVSTAAKKKTTKKAVTAKTTKTAKKTTKKSTKAAKTTTKKAAAKKTTKTTAAKEAAFTLPAPPIEDFDEDAPKKPARRGRPPKKLVVDSEATFRSSEARLDYIRNWTTIIETRKMQARENLGKFIESAGKDKDAVAKLQGDLSKNSSEFHQNLRELGFREEYEKDEDSPFNPDKFTQFVNHLKFDK